MHQARSIRIFDRWQPFGFALVEFFFRDQVSLDEVVTGVFAT